MKAVISGRNGFIGNHLADALETQGVKVIALPRELLTDFVKLEEFFKKEKPDYIFHLAAYGNHGFQKENFLETVRINLFGSTNILLSSRDIPYKAFINFGSSSEYGHKSAPMKESDVLEADFFYGATKASITQIARACAKQWNKSIVTVRPFSVFGPGEADWRLIPNAIKHMLEGREFPFNPAPEHDWIYVKDFIDALMLVTKNAGELKGKVVNIGTGKAYTNKEVINSLTFVAEKGIKTVNTYLEPSHHSKRWVADISLLKSLGWKPSFIDLHGLEETWLYYKERYEKQGS